MLCMLFAMKLNNVSLLHGPGNRTMRSFWGLLSHQKSPSVYLLKTQLQPNNRLAPVASAIASDPLTASPVASSFDFRNLHAGVCVASGPQAHTISSMPHHVAVALVLLSRRSLTNGPLFEKFPFPQTVSLRNVLCLRLD